MDDEEAEVHCCVVLCVVYESEIQVGKIHWGEPERAPN